MNGGALETEKSDDVVCSSTGNVCVDWYRTAAARRTSNGLARGVWETNASTVGFSMSASEGMRRAVSKTTGVRAIHQKNATDRSHEGDASGT